MRPHLLPFLPLLLLPACASAPEPAPAAPVQTQTVVVAVTPLPEEPAPSAADPADAPEATPEATPEPPPARSSGEGTPPFLAKFAVVFRAPASTDPNDPFSGDELLLLRERASCKAARSLPESDRLRVSMRWQPGSMSFQHLLMKDGKVTQYRGTIEIHAAPTAVGATGRLRLDPGERGNLGGGEIPALVCE